ncbi:carboxymuconolactone decarboxylase family protein [Halarcobacter sp.]|uniref:carboxymuconolactone decarboxylase family protein n=1 Tax=Halarcobacter sp. TaxID=2321133 RepID=UPI002AAB9891|nr:carboxymuconolactone decarboxylase family protein [Halarcobacter sp.]
MLKKVLFIIIFFNLLFTSSLLAKEEIKMLDKKQQSMVTISAFTANGDLDKLKVAFNEGLDSKLTINEIKETIAHLYAYTGFPRSLNSLNLFMQVVDERKVAGKEDIVGKEVSPKPENYDSIEYGKKIRAKLAGLKEDYTGTPYQVFTPVVDEYLLGHLFGDIFVRDVLTHEQRELITISALAAMRGTQGQLNFHLKAAMNTGITKDQLNDFIKIIDTKVDSTQAKLSKETLEKVLDSK